MAFSAKSFRDQRDLYMSSLEAPIDCLSVQLKPVDC